MANKFTKPKREKRKPKKKIFSSSRSNGKITTKRAMYDNNLVGLQPGIPTQSGY